MSVPNRAETPNHGDAGMHGLDHYQDRLPNWRFVLREALIPIVRWETPYLAYLQREYRTPALDSYFALTANLGTHTFFMIMLPILFWSGETRIARAMTHILASGVFFSAFLKDLVCLPRPLSPPLQRISRSASVALEYGFPSTHSTNAVSVAVYAIHALNTSTVPMQWWLSMTLQTAFIFYATSIVVGRMYCGMHGFFDVILGSILGAALALVQCTFGDWFDDWVFDGPLRNVIIVTLIILVLIRIHPEPADDCPCFDDSVAFCSVLIGIQLGAWHFAQTGFSMNEPVPSTVPFSLEKLGYVRAVLRIVVGVVVIFAWRGFMKPALLKALPPIFRVVEYLGLSLPRKFHLRASQYKRVPPLRKDDNLIPPASEIPALLTSLRHPRKRAISIGPQSEADAYEAIAFREQRRRESMTSPAMARTPRDRTKWELNEGYFTQTSNGRPSFGVLQPESRRQVQLENNVGVDETVLLTPLHEGSDVDRPTETFARSVSADDAQQEREMFRKLYVPRVRYDVEVITKLVVYTGIAWLAVEGNPILFEYIGLGMGVRPT